MTLADSQGVDRDRIVVSHQSLGEMEWPGTSSLVHRQAEAYGLRVVITRSRNRDGLQRDLLQHVRERGMWPSRAQRFCTSEHKRGPGGRVLTRLARRIWDEKKRKVQVLNVFGFRAEESPARAKRKAVAVNARFSNSRKRVVDWLPIHRMAESEVWDDIKASGVPYHPAYDLGMPRLSCVFCIFAPKSALKLAGFHNRDLLDRYVEVEDGIKHTFKDGESLRSIRDEFDQGCR